MHEHLSGGLSVWIMRLAGLMAVAMLAACGGESGSRARGVGGQGAQLGAGGSADGAGGGTSEGTGGDATGTGGAGGSGTGGAGGSGTGGTGSPDAGADGGGGSGIVVLSVPFTAPNTGTFFNCPIAPGSAMILGGHTATFSVCVSTGTANPSLYLFQAYATDSLSGQGTYGPAAPFVALTICPTMTPVALTITNTTVVVTALGLHISSVATDGAAFGTAALEVDSISVSGDTVGPYLFRSDAQGFMAATFQAVPNSMVTWQANP